MPNHGKCAQKIYSDNGEMFLSVIEHEENLVITLYAENIIVFRQEVDKGSKKFKVMDNGDIYFLIDREKYHYDVSCLHYPTTSSSSSSTTAIHSGTTILGSISAEQPIIDFHVLSIENQPYLILIGPKLLQIINELDNFNTVYKKDDKILTDFLPYYEKINILVGYNDIHNRVVVDRIRLCIFYRVYDIIYRLNLKNLETSIYFKHQFDIDGFCISQDDMIAILNNTNRKSMVVVDANRIKPNKFIDSMVVDFEKIVTFYIDTLSNNMVFISKSVKKLSTQNINIAFTLYHMFNSPPVNCLKLQILDLERDRIKEDIEFHTNPHLDLIFSVDDSGVLCLDNGEIREYYTLAVSLYDNSKCYLNLPTAAGSLPISGLELVAWAHEAVSDILRQYKQIQKPTRITRATDWLTTAGHYSRFCAGIDLCQIRKEGYQAGNLIVLTNPNAIAILRTNSGDAYVHFNNLPSGDYSTITDKLMHMATAPWKDYSLDDIIAALSDSSRKQLKPNPHHGLLARSLLARIGGNNYSDEFKENQEFLDTLLSLFVVVEGSRNNVAFLTSILMLDLIAGNHTFGRHSRAFNWRNAFHSGPGYVWNDAEHKDLGGKYSMAANSTGQFNLRHRADAIKITRTGSEEAIAKETYRIIKEKQHHYVLIREMKLILTWLRKYIGYVDLTFLSQATDKIQVKKDITALFKRRLTAAYSSAAPTLFLSENTSGYMHGNVLPRHYERESDVFSVVHRKDAIDPKAPKPPKPIETEAYYHRVDYPCKLVAEYVLRGQQKELTFPKHRLSVQTIMVLKKHQISLFRTSKSQDMHLITTFADKGIILERPFICLRHDEQDSIVDAENAQRIWELIDRYILWRKSYFNAALLMTHQPTASTFFHYMKRYADYRLLTMACIQKIKWQPVDNDDYSMRIDSTQISKIIDGLAQDEQYTDSIKAVDKHRKDYINQLLRAIHLCIDPIFEKGTMKWPAIDISIPTENDMAHQLNGLTAAHRIVDTPINRAIISALPDLDDNFFNYKAVFDIGTRKPCPCCYASDTEPYPAMPFNHDEVICFVKPSVGLALTDGAKDSLYHRVGSACDDKTTSKHYQFVLQAKEAQQQACPDCWIPIVADKHTKRQVSLRPSRQEPRTIKRQRNQQNDTISPSVLADDDVDGANVFINPLTLPNTPSASASSDFPWYTDADIQSYLVVAITQGVLRGYEQNTYRIHTTHADGMITDVDGNAYYTFLLPAIDILPTTYQVPLGQHRTLGSLPLTHHIDKTQRSPTELMTLIEMVCQQESRDALVTLLAEAESQGNRHEKLHELLHNHAEWTDLKPLLQQMLVQEQGIDLVDELLACMTAPEARAKVLFAYNQGQRHWLVGELILVKNDKNYRVMAYTHDPYGGGQVSPLFADALKQALIRRLQQHDTESRVTFSCRTSPYNQRQRTDDTVSCGPIAAHDIMKRLQGQSLDVSEPYPYGAPALRQAQQQPREINQAQLVTSAASLGSSDFTQTDATMLLASSELEQTIASTTSIASSLGSDIYATPSEAVKSTELDSNRFTYGS